MILCATNYVIIYISDNLFFKNGAELVINFPAKIWLSAKSAILRLAGR